MSLSVFSKDWYEVLDVDEGHRTRINGPMAKRYNGIANIAYSSNDEGLNAMLKVDLPLSGRGEDKSSVLELYLVPMTQICRNHMAVAEGSPASPESKHHPVRRITGRTRGNLWGSMQVAYA